MTSEPVEILVIEEDAFYGETLKRALAAQNVGCVLVTSVAKGMEVLDRNVLELAVLGWTRRDEDNTLFIKHAKETCPATYILVATFDPGFSKRCPVPDVDEVIVKGSRIENVVNAILLALKRGSDKFAIGLANRAARPALDRLIGNSAPMQGLREEIGVVGQSEDHVLIEGETGTGKSLVAEAIHQTSRRKSGPFVPIVNLGENLTESELFGTVKGAFTDSTGRMGLLEYAHRGTAFFDDITDLRSGAQANLLFILDRKAIRRVGGTESKTVDIRVVAASNRPLDEEVREKRFRQDLYYRLRVLHIRVPPLRERSSDIPLLADFFLRQRGKSYRDLSDEVKGVLLSHDYPGNIRELENLMRGAATRSRPGRIGLDDLGIGGMRAGQSDCDATIMDRPFKQANEEFEKRYLTHWRKKGGTISDCARSIGMSREQIHRKLKRYGLDWSRE